MWSNSYIQLTPHPVARNTVIAKSILPSGTTALVCPVSAFVLLHEEKGRRCDACCRLREHELKRCSRCQFYFYCNAQCQISHWKSSHRLICSALPEFLTSGAYKSQSSHRQLDSLLLSHFIAEHMQINIERETINVDSDAYDFDDPISVYFSLLPSTKISSVPPTCLVEKSRRVHRDLIKQIYGRFDNNNFVIHRQFKAIAHGIFPLASRLFNHSCMPNAVAVYTLSNSGISIQVKALRPIREGEELTIPYFDPALPFQQRQQICRLTYDFQCHCDACVWTDRIGEVSLIEDHAELISNLQSFVPFCYSRKALGLENLPSSLHPILHESFLPSLSLTFSNASHDGPFTSAINTGEVLLKLYTIIYPPGYPVIGMHCLELAKTIWNTVVQGGIIDVGLVAEARRYLDMARETLQPLQPGDREESDTSNEIATLYTLFNETTV